MPEFSEAVGASMASKGRGGDNQIAHVGTGEVVIPARVLDENPGFVGQVVKAMQNSGLDWRRYMVGGDKNSKNPSTGQPEFFAGMGGAAGMSRDVSDAPGGNRDGGMSNAERGFRDSFRGGFSVDDMGGGRGDYGTGQAEIERGRARDMMQEAIDAGLPDFTGDGRESYSGQFKKLPLGRYNPAGKLLGGVMDAGQRAGDILGGAFDSLGGVSDVPESLGADRGIDTTGSAVPAITRPVATEPVELGFDPGMNDLQRRAAISTFGLNSPDSLYSDPAVKDYYRSLIFDAVSSGGAGALLPIERQYIEQILGIPVGDNLDSLLYG